MYRLLHFFFGWDYIAWANSVDSGVARVHVDGAGLVFYWRYKSTHVADQIRADSPVLWLTCSPRKYFPTGEEA